jgi:hypothetical protein
MRGTLGRKQPSCLVLVLERHPSSLLAVVDFEGKFVVPTHGTLWDVVIYLAQAVLPDPSYSLQVLTSQGVKLDLQTLIGDLANLADPRDDIVYLWYKETARYFAWSVPAPSRRLHRFRFYPAEHRRREYDRCHNAYQNSRLYEDEELLDSPFWDEDGLVGSRDRGVFLQLEKWTLKARASPSSFDGSLTLKSECTVRQLKLVLQQRLFLHFDHENDPEILVYDASHTTLSDDVLLDTIPKLDDGFAYLFYDF